jgi:urease accessory protein
VVQKPFYPEGAPCHCYLLHPPGGVVGGDELEINVHVAKQAHALVTTPAAGKFYRSDGRLAKLEQKLTVADDALLEWLPQETIFFNGCKVHASTRIDLQAEARLVAWEIACLGRPASKDWFSTGECTQRIELWRDNQPVFLERGRYTGGGDVLAAKWGLANCTVSGTMLVTPADRNMLENARNIECQFESSLFSASLLDDVLVCRFLGNRGEHARKCFTYVWSAIRPQLANRPVSVPRIWST